MSSSSGLGLAFTSATPSLALFAGGLGALVAPGLESAIVARGGESVFRSSLFRAGYEVFYTPVPPPRSAPRNRSSTWASTASAMRLAAAPSASSFCWRRRCSIGTIIVSTLVCSAAAIVVASRLSSGYVQTLERNLRGRAVEMDLSEVADLTTRTTMLDTLLRSRLGAELWEGGPVPADVRQSTTVNMPTGLDPEIQDIIRLRSRDRDRVLAVLRRDQELTPALIPHVIPLLAWDPVADDAMRALPKVAPSHVGALADALLDPYEDFAVRRRIPRVMAVCSSQRAVDSLLLGLEDMRFEVRFQCGRALAAIVAKQPDLRVDPARVFEVVQKEVAVGRPVWEGRRLLDRLDDGKSNSFVDEFIRSRASQSLAHVFTMLSLVLPAEPLQIALRGLHVDDQNLRGTALEYLESVLPPIIREPLWPFLEDRRPAGRTIRAREDILADLVRSNHSIMLNLEELKRRTE